MSNPIARLIYRVEQLERKLANVVREGRVTQRDAATGRVKVAIAEGDSGPVETPWIKPAEHGGVLQTWALPKVGQHMKLISPDGEIGRNTIAIAHSYANGVDQPSTDGDEPMFKVGNAEIRIKDGRISIKVGAATMTLTDGVIELKVGDVSQTLRGDGTTFAGGTIKHDGKSIDAGHIHGGVAPGPVNTDVPAN